MKPTLFVLFISVSFLSVSCSGGGAGALSFFDSKNQDDVTKTIPASQVETTKLQAAIQSEPEYKIETSELELLQKEGIISESDIKELQAIQ